jgi:hypothetical protein
MPLDAIAALDLDPRALDASNNLPQRMREARRWLVYKLVPRPGGEGKPRKVPHYVDGSPRRGALDSPQDAARLGTLAQALERLGAGGYAGLGFALGPDGDGHWQGIDFDAMSRHPELEALAHRLPGYREWSPSGDGMHAIGYGRAFPPLAANTTGIEAYSGGRFFTVTGEAMGGELTDLAPFVAESLEPMHAIADPEPRGRGEPRPVPAQEAGQGGGDIEEIPRLLEDLRSALEAIPADNYDEWIAVGHALAGLGEDGRELWVRW